MTPREKAEELYQKYYKSVERLSEGYASRYDKTAKQCALIAVDEIIKSHRLCLVDKKLTHPMENYWQEVKTEIEKL